MTNTSRILSYLAIALAAICLGSYLSIDWLGLPAKLVVILFWLAIGCSIGALGTVRPTNYKPLLFAAASWALLWPASWSALAWSAWWYGGFAR